MRIVTDSAGLEEAKDPDSCNIFALYKLFADAEEQDAMRARYTAGGMGYGEAKKALLEKFETYFETMRERREKLSQEAGYVDAVLEAGAKKAQSVAQKTLAQARGAVGL